MPRGVFVVRCAGRTPARDGGEWPISTTEPRVNERIRVPRVRLIGVDGSQLGVFATDDAMRIADDQGLDLVEVAPNADPPVCRIMDYGKFKYEQDMKAKKARKHQTRVEIKEIKFRPKIDEHDYQTKKRHVLRFLNAGAKVKVTIMFRGREMAHAERGLAILDRLAQEVEDLAMVESPPKLEGRNMLMMLQPLKKEQLKEADEGEADEGETDEGETDAAETTEAEANEGQAAGDEVETGNADTGEDETADAAASED